MTHDQSPRETLEYRSGDVVYRGQRIRPREPRGTGILIAPDWRGIGPYVLAQADRLASRGHDVMVADLYGDGLYAEDEAAAGALLKGLITDRVGLTARMQVCTEAFRATLPAGAAIGALGLSIGGMAVLDLGRSGAALHGIVLSSALLRTAEPGRPVAFEAEVLVLQGTRDVVCPMDQVSALVKEMDEAKNRFRFVLYGGAHHAYYNPEVGTDPTARLVYSAETDRLANAEIDRFLEETLRS